MSPVTHLLISWSIANSFRINRRERALVTLAGVASDFDGAGIILDVFRGSSDHSFQLYNKFHHVLGHNIGFGLLLIIITLFLSKRILLPGVLVFITFHLHLICDLIGSKGPGGYQWPIPYLLPFSDSWQLVWEYQWELNAWPNFVVTIFALILTLFFSWKKGLSPLEIVSLKANNVFVNTLRKRFGNPTEYKSA